MRNPISLLISVLLFTAGATTVSAAGHQPASKTRNRPYSGPALVVKPMVVKPHSPFTLDGKKFATRRTLKVELDCPMFGHSRNAHATWKAKTNRSGSFSLKVRAPSTRKNRATLCNLYVLNTPAKKTPFYVSISFRIS